MPLFRERDQVPLDVRANNMDVRISSIQVLTDKVRLLSKPNFFHVRITVKEIPRPQIIWFAGSSILGLSQGCSISPKNYLAQNHFAN
jgi:hypothetical protein